jgi:hypothetical protein
MCSPLELNQMYPYTFSIMYTSFVVSSLIFSVQYISTFCCIPNPYHPMYLQGSTSNNTSFKCILESTNLKHFLFLNYMMGILQTKITNSIFFCNIRYLLFLMKFLSHFKVLTIILLLSSEHVYILS